MGKNNRVRRQSKQRQKVERDRVRTAQRVSKAAKATVPLAKLLAKWDTDSVLALLYAAACAPSASHRIPSIAYALHTALLQQTASSLAVTTADLDAILAAARLAEPGLVQLEDYVPLDPTLDVVVRVDGRIWSLHPGALERPVAVLRRACLIADALAAANLAEAVSLHQLIVAVLRRVSEGLMVLRPTWSSPNGLTPDSPVRISSQEFDIAQRAMSLINSMNFESEVEEIALK